VEAKKYVPPYIYCPRCGRKIFLEELAGEELMHIRDNGYVAGARGVCDCGVVLVMCVQEMPKSPTFSLFFDVYAIGDKKRYIAGSPTNSMVM